LPRASFLLIHVEDFDIDFHVGIEVAAEVAVVLELRVNCPGSYVNAQAVWLEPRILLK
jgi:hypothetical protein